MEESVPCSYPSVIARSEVTKQSQNISIVDCHASRGSARNDYFLYLQLLHFLHFFHFFHFFHFPHFPHFLHFFYGSPLTKSASTWLNSAGFSLIT